VAEAVARSILVVEDDDDIRFGLTYALEDEGYQVTEARNGKEALDQLRAGTRPDIIILDIMMEVMDGKTFLKIVRRDHPDDLAKIPVVIATAGRGQPHELPAAAALLRKPFDLDALLRVVGGLTADRPT
jgi:CheY-like chemotaxis protein